MRSTSFGCMETLLEQDGQVEVEHLVFGSEGNAHTHDRHETFVVLEGEGVVVVGDREVEVEPGSAVTVPPNTDHWMIPAEGQQLRGLLWYHEEPLRLEDPLAG